MGKHKVLAGDEWFPVSDMVLSMGKSRGGSFLAIFHGMLKPIQEDRANYLRKIHIWYHHPEKSASVS